jgi:hypothetical protein
MTDETPQQAIRRMVAEYPDATHSENCWKWHLSCAALLCADELDALLLMAGGDLD